MKFAPIDPIADPRYAAFVAAHPAATLYHSPLWAQVIAQTYPRGRPLYLAGFTDRERIAAVIPAFFSGSRHLVALPMTTVCDPLVASDEMSDPLPEALTAVAAKSPATETELHLSRPNPALEALGFHHNESYVNQCVDISPAPDTLFQTFHKTTIQQRIRRSAKLGLELETAECEEQIEIFFKLHIRNRKRNGLPPLPLPFFRQLWRVLTPRGVLSLLMVKAEGRCIASLILLHDGDTAHAEYTASDPAAFRLSPNQFLYWEAILQAKQRGRRYFDLGRSDRENQGLIDFKSRWGAVTQPLHYYHLPRIPDRRGFAFGLAQSLFSRMPESWLRLAGSTLHRLRG